MISINKKFYIKITPLKNRDRFLFSFFLKTYNTHNLGWQIFQNLFVMHRRPVSCFFITKKVHFWKCKYWLLNLPLHLKDMWWNFIPHWSLNQKFHSSLVTELRSSLPSSLLFSKTTFWSASSSRLLSLFDINLQELD